MSSTTSEVHDVESDARTTTSTVESQRRLKQRREMLLVQAMSYVAGALILLIYAYAGTISTIIPLSFLLTGVGLTAVFVVLSEMHVGDRFNDHFLTSYQAATNIVMQLGFLVAAPEVGVAFIIVIFVIFVSAALRMTSREATILWGVTGIGLAATLFHLRIQISLPMITGTEWLAGTSLIVTTLGQCAYFGVFGHSVKKKLHQRNIELKVANQRIEELAQLDELTGVLNRRQIMKCLNQEMVRAQRSHLPCSVAIIDLDHFKRINDQFGHPAGDEALRTFAIAVFANIRTIDKLGRYGGEEFLLILPNTSKDEAVRTLDRLRSIISGVDWSAISGQLKVTMSAGICSVRAGDSDTDILARADVALYRAKDAGRNRVVAELS